MRELEIKNLAEFAKHFGIGRSTLYELVRGRSPSAPSAWKTPTLETLILLAKALEKPLHEIIYLIEPNAPGAELLHSQQTKEGSSHMRELQIKVAGWCGAGPDQNEEVLDECVCVEESFVRGRDLVAFRIRGDSMEGGKRPIYSGDTVLVDRGDKGYDTASVVARLTSGGYVCKTLKDDKFGVHLVSSNSLYTNGTPPYIPQSEIDEIVGRVVRIVHDDTAS
jgi:repressor LexA